MAWGVGEAKKGYIAALAFGVAALLALLLAAEAEAGLAYTPAQPLSAPAQSEFDIYTPRVAVGPSGVATVAWMRNERIELRRIAADGTLGPVQTLPGGAGQYGASLVTDVEDRTTVVWTQYTDGEPPAAKTARIAADGTIGPTRTVSDPAVPSYGATVALDAEGRATVAWVTDEYIGGTEERTVAISRLDALGVPGPVVTVSEYAGYRAPRLAVAPSGVAMVAWGREQRVLATRVAADDTPGKLITLVDHGYFPSPDVAVDSAGRFTIAWADRYPEDAVRLARFEADGSPQPVRSIDGPTTTYALTPDVVVDDEDRTTVLWANCTSGDCGGRLSDPFYRAYSSRLGAAGFPGPPQLLSGPVESPPVSAVDGLGRITAVWPRLRYHGIAANRLAPDGSSGGAVPASRPSVGYTHSPSVAVDDAGRATVVWVNRNRSRVEFSRSYFDARLRGSVSAKRRQRQGPEKVRIRVRVNAGEPLAFNARGRIAMKGRDYAVKLKRARMPADTTTVVRLRPNWRDHRIAERIQEGEKAVARLEVRIRDHAGNSREKQLEVRLLPARD